MTVEIIVRAPVCPVLVTQTTEFRQPFGTGEQYTKTEITTRVDQGGEQTFYAHSFNSIRVDPLPSEPVPAPLFDYEGMYPSVAGVPPIPNIPDHHPLSGGELDTSGERRTPSHFCNICGADWCHHPETPDEEEYWELLSSEKDKCCGDDHNRHLRVKAHPIAEPDHTAHDAADGDVVIEADHDHNGEAIDPDLRA